MVLSGTKKTSSISSIVNAQQGGGSKKAGMSYQVGRIAWSSIALGLGNSAYTRSTKRCYGLPCLRTNAVSWTVSPSRPIGRQVSTYWTI
jgi:hypothetical protein